MMKLPKSSDPMKMMMTSAKRMNMTKMMTLIKTKRYGR